jgi:hypothetical protein
VAVFACRSVAATTGYESTRVGINPRLTQPPLHTFALRGRASQIEWLRSGTDVFPAPTIPFSATESMFAVRYWDIPATIKADISITQIVRQKTMTFGYKESDRVREGGIRAQALTNKDTKWLFYSIPSLGQDMALVSLHNLNVRVCDPTVSVQVVAEVVAPRGLV